MSVLLVGLALAQPAEAQDRGVRLEVRGGGFNGLVDLNESGTADFARTGYNVGGGVAVQLLVRAAVRGREGRELRTGHE